MSSEYQLVTQDDIDIQDAPVVRVPHPLFKGPLNLNKHAKKRIIEFRRERVSELCLQGWTEARIANELGVSNGTVHNDVVAIRNEWRAATVDNAEQQASLDLARLEFAIRGVMPRVLLGDDDAIHTMIRIIQQKGRILGYGGGMTIDVEQYLRSIAEANGLDPEKGVEIAQRISINIR